MTIAVQDSADGISFTGAVSASTATFRLLGGKYAFACEAPSTSATLSVEDAAGNFISVYAFTSSGGYEVLDLVAGTFELTFVATSAVAGFVQRVPYLPR